MWNIITIESPFSSFSSITNGPSNDPQGPNKLTAIPPRCMPPEAATREVGFEGKTQDKPSIFQKTCTYVHIYMYIYINKNTYK